VAGSGPQGRGPAPSTPEGLGRPGSERASVARRHSTGRLGEALAARALEGEGWRILARRWRDGPRELDLVAARGRVLLFVEVKTRRQGGVGAALASVTRAKQREIERAAAAWLRREGPGHPGFREVRFDVVVVLLEPGSRPRVERVEGAWVRGGRGW
jgi:putative endonuclease